MRAMLLALGAAALVPTSAAPLYAQPFAQSRTEDAALRAELRKRASADLRPFYEARGYRPLWLDRGEISPAAGALLDQIDTADRDGIDPRRLKPDALARSLDRAGSGQPADVARAELALSKAYVAYVTALRRAPRAGMIYESEALSPVVPTATAALSAAAAAGALDAHVRKMGWMHPLYAPLRAAFDDRGLTFEQRRQVALNLERLRAIPANPARRYVLVDANAARLWMYEDGRPIEAMRVVVGKPEADTQTPMMAGFIRYAIVNPYWNVPEDLVRSRIAWNVNTKGAGYLRSGGYQVLSDWSDKPSVVDPATIDWQAVEAGAPAPRVRQLPGGSNFMGSVKFMFPNPQGIYLHDTPERNLMAKEARQFSSGCVRLEDAQKLGRWLLGKPLPRRLRSPEQRIELPEVVPVYITYLTAMPENGRVAFRPDVYSRDGDGETRLADNGRRLVDRP